MSVSSIQHVNLRVPPELLRTLRDFYCEVLGLSEGWRPPFESEGYWLYAGDAPIVHLVARRPQEPEVQSGAASVDHFALQCTDLKGTLTHLDRCAVKYAVTTVPVLGDTQIFFRDPIGTGIELSFDTASSS